MLADVLMLVVALQALGGVEIKKKRSWQKLAHHWQCLSGLYLYMERFAH